MIYDCFTFYNELDLLELRLRLLDEVVDRFVLCEAPFTFRGNPKPLAYALAQQRFAPWRERILALVYPGPSDPDPWRNEWGQRDYLATALAGCAADDLILVGDVDEIPDPRNVAYRPSPGKILGHLQRLSIGYLNRVTSEPWAGTRALAARDLAHYRTLTGVRGRPQTELETVAGGWHFSSLGGAAVAEAKMRAYSHLEYDVTYYRDPFRLEVSFASDHDAHWIPFDDSFPPLLHDDRWSGLIWERPGPESAALAPALEHAHGCFGYVPADAPAVYAVTADVDVWARAGAQRFGVRFGAAVARTQACIEGLGPHAWVVVDGLERHDAQSLEALRATGAGVVAYAGNARSRDVVEAVVTGAPFPPGRVLGLAELRAWIRALGWDIGAVDRIAIPGVFAIFAQLPEQLSVANGRFRFSSIARDTLVEFLAKAYVVTLPPRQGLK